MRIFPFSPFGKTSSITRCLLLRRFLFIRNSIIFLQKNSMFSCASFSLSRRKKTFPSANVCEFVTFLNKVSCSSLRMLFSFTELTVERIVLTTNLGKYQCKAIHRFICAVAFFLFLIADSGYIDMSSFIKIISNILTHSYLLFFCFLEIITF